MTKQERYIQITTLEIEIMVAIEDGNYEEAIYLQEELNTVYKDNNNG